MWCVVVCDLETSRASVPVQACTILLPLLSYFLQLSFHSVAVVLTPHNPSHSDKIHKGSKTKCYICIKKESPQNINIQLFNNYIKKTIKQYCFALLVNCTFYKCLYRLKVQVKKNVGTRCMNAVM